MAARTRTPKAAVEAKEPEAKVEAPAEPQSEVTTVNAFFGQNEEPKAAPPIPPAPEVQYIEPQIVSPTTKRARVKGTWTQYYGPERHDFVDGQSYDLSPSLYDYLRQRGCIYDTLA